MLDKCWKKINIWKPISVSEKKRKIYRLNKQIDIVTLFLINLNLYQCDLF